MMARYGILLDLNRCTGCMTCVIACKEENLTRPGVWWNRVLELESESLNRMTYFRYACMHCDDPPCVDACPEEIINKRDDGIVVLDDGLCTGCRLCLEACPYDAIDFDEEQEIAHKCNLCHTRVDNGLLPACADNICLAHCIYFGDPEKPELKIEN